MPIPVQSRMFGVSLNDLMGFDGEKDGLPRVVRDCIHYLRDAGTLLEQRLITKEIPELLVVQVLKKKAYSGAHRVLSSFGKSRKRITEVFQNAL